MMRGARGDDERGRTNVAECYEVIPKIHIERGPRGESAALMSKKLKDRGADLVDAV